MEEYKNLPEYKKLDSLIKRLDRFKKSHEREFESESHWGEMLKHKKIFREDLNEGENKEYDEIFKELSEANMAYLKIVSLDIYNFNLKNNKD